MPRALYPSRLMLGLLFGAAVAQAADRALPLDPGNYVVASERPCEQAPLAGVMAFDGASFAGPHASACQTTILARHGSRYRVRTQCKALGDGSPAAAGAVVRDVRIESRTTYAVNRGKQATEYALCPAFQ